MIHPSMANVKKDDIKAKLASKFGSAKDRITIYGLKTQFGGGRSSGFALIYNSTEDKNKYDSKSALKRVSLTISVERETKNLFSNGFLIRRVFL